MPEPLNTLIYERSVDRDGVAVERSEGFTRIITSPPGTWRTVSVGFYLSAGYCGMLVIGSLVAVLNSSGGDRTAAVAGGILYALILCAIIFTASMSVYCRYIFDISTDVLTVRRTSFGIAPSAATYRRDSVGLIRRNPYNGLLAIHITGKDLLELPVGGDRDVVERIATELNSAVHSTAPVDRTLPDGLIEPPPKAPNRTFQLAMSGVTGLMLIAAIWSYLRGFQPITLLLLLFSAVPVGIAHGTQRSKFWF